MPITFSPSEAFCNLSCTNAEIWLCKWKELKNSTNKNCKALKDFLNSASVKDVTLYAGAECNKDFFTSTLHNLVVSCTAVPNSPDKAYIAVYITVIVMPHAYMHAYVFVFKLPLCL